MSASPKDILEYARTIAVVGGSRDPAKPSGSVPLSLVDRGYRVIAVNPFAETLYGERAYRELAEVPERIDVVQVFRPAAEAEDIAFQAVSIGARAVWLQLGIVSPGARRVAEDAGLDYVEDLCMATECAHFGIDKMGPRSSPTPPPPAGGIQPGAGPHAMG